MLRYNKEATPLVAEHPPENDSPVLVKRPWQRYGLAILPTGIVILSFLFYGLLNSKGGISAPQSLAKMVTSNPRLSAQVVTILGSFLTVSIKWGLGRVFSIVAQKRLVALRTIYEIELWSSLKNGGVLWDFKQNRVRWAGTTAMMAVAVLCGLLTSGFVSLLSPLPIKLTEQIIGADELNYAAPLCSTWIQASVGDQDYWNGGCTNWFHYEDYSFQRCETANQLYEVLDAGRASMLNYTLSTKPSANPQAYISTLNRMEGARVLGSTGGVIPIGPSGVSAFKVQAASNPENIDHFQANSSYTINMQGIWCDVSCQYIDPASFVWDQKILNSSCSTTPDKILERPTTGSEITLDSCAYQSNDVWIYYVRSNIQDAAKGNPFAGIGTMSCKVVPHLKTIEATYDPHLSAFVMKPLEELEKPPVAIYSHADWYTRKTMSQRGGYGNLAGSLIDLTAVARLGLPGAEKHEGYPPLVASMIKGVYEYQATQLRVVLSTVYRSTAPPECFRSVKGTVTYPGVGWQAQPATLISLLPHAILGVLIISLTAWAVSGQEGMKVFDPTSPVSLIAGASVGGIQFYANVVGDPEDEEVRRTRVKYDLLPGTSRPQWGLVDGANYGESKA